MKKIILGVGIVGFVFLSGVMTDLNLFSNFRTDVVDALTSADIVPDNVLEENSEEKLENSTSTAHLIVRNGQNIIFDGDISLVSGTTTFQDQIISSNSVLNILNLADLESGNFELSGVDYYDSWQAFYLSCLKLNGDVDTDLCYNWNYVVNNQYSYLAIEDYELQDGDRVYLYFGSSNRLTAPATTTVNIPTNFLVEEYDYQNDLWLPVENYVVGSIEYPDSANPWFYVELATSSSDINGLAQLNFSNPGDYLVGLQTNYYYPAYTVRVSTSTTDGVSTGGGSGGNNTDKQFNTQTAIDFLLSQQKTDGRFQNDMLTDWTAVGLGAHKSANSDLINFLEEGLVGNDLLDKLRRAMALLSVSKNPQNYHGNLIQKILEDFDGQQFGDKDIFNDDIFAVLVLQNVGFDRNDPEIKKTIDFILSAQDSNGSWNGPDLTAAAIQAISNFSDLDGVPNAVNKAKNYLQTNQQTNGGWGNVYSTSWTMLAMNNLGENWKTNKTSENYLAELQDSDGGLLKNDSDENRIWSTAYALAAVSGSDWNEIFKNFSKNKITKQDQEKDKIDDDKAEEESNNILETASSTSPIIETAETDLFIPDIVEDSSNQIEDVREVVLDQATSSASIDDAKQENLAFAGGALTDQNNYFLMYFGFAILVVIGIIYKLKF